MSNQPPSSLRFLTGETEMAERLRSFDWSNTSLGTPEFWPTPLQTLVGVMLGSRQAMCIMWGPEQIFLYNDGYADILVQKHPAALGQPIKDVWPEIWPDLKPIVDATYAGQATHIDDMAFTMMRKGYPEEAHFSFSFTPIFGHDDQVLGSFMPVVETTERVFRERQARLEGKRFAQLFEQAPTFMTVLRGPQHVFEYCNPGYKQLIGHRDFIGQPAAIAVPEAAGQGFFELLDDVYQSGKAFSATGMKIELQRTPGADLEERYLDFVYQPIIEDDGSVSGIFVEGIDVTERVRGDLDLRASEVRFHDVANAAPVLIWMSDTTKGCTWFNKGWLDFVGRPIEMELGAGWAENVHPDDLERCLRFYEASFDARETFRMDYRLRRFDGEWRMVDAHGVPRFASDGLFLGYIGSSSDVTEQRGAESAVHRTAEQLHLATEAADIGFWDVDLINDRLFWPPRVNEMFGISPDHSVSLTDFYAGIHPDDFEHVHAAFGDALDPGKRTLYDVEFRTIGKEDGIIRWVAAKGKGFFDDAGVCTRAVGTAIDITQRKAVEEQLRNLTSTLENRVAEAVAERNILADIVETTDAMVQLLDHDYNWLAVNRAMADEFERVYGVRPVVGGNMLLALEDLPKHQAAVRTLWQRALAGEEFTTIEEFGEPTLGRAVYEIKFSTLRDRHGGNVGAYQFVYDVTERLQDQARLAEAENHLRQAQKMEAVGQLTGGIAHDFNNMLAVVLGSLELVSRRIGADDPKAKRQLESASEAARRAASLTQRLLAFSRQQPLKPETTDVNRLITNMQDLLRHAIGADIRVASVLAEAPWRVNIDPNQLENAILNLGVNARDAMPDGGQLTIKSENLRISESLVKQGYAVPVGDYVVISVTDTGAGMTPDILAKAFDPFYTTKAVGKGTGLGLSQVYGFVKQSGGYVKIASDPGKGTSITIYLPRTLDALSMDDESAARVLRPKAFGECVLVVDDEPAVRQFSVEALEELGYRVLQAETASAALKILEENPDIALLFTDVVMPDTDGPKLAALARALRPQVKVLFTTGYTRDAAVGRGHFDPGTALIGKPFGLDDLGVKIRSVLDQPPSLATGFVPSTPQP